MKKVQNIIEYKKFFSLLLPWFFFASFMNFFRFFTTDLSSYVYMHWNFFLALLPLLFLFFLEKTKFRFFQFFLFLLSFFFLPNSIYILTDFIHLREVGSSVMIWFDALMLFSYAFSALILFTFSVYKMYNLIIQSYTQLNKNFFFFLISFLSAFGVYLGRYIRWNTWDIVLHPYNLFQDSFSLIMHSHENTLFLQTILFFTLVSLVSLLSFQKIFQKTQ